MEEMLEPLHAPDPTSWAVWADWLEENGHESFVWAREVSEGLKVYPKLYLVYGVVGSRAYIRMPSNRNLHHTWVALPRGKPSTGISTRAWSPMPLHPPIAPDAKMVKDFYLLARDFYQTIQVLRLEDMVEDMK